MADLEQLFLTSASGAVRARLASAANLQARLQALVQKAHDAWPGIEVPAEELVARLARALGEDGGAATLESLHVEDLALAIACGRQDRAALDVLERLVLPAAARTRRGPIPDDVVQQLREKAIVQGKIAEYGGRGALRQWLRMVATRLWLDAGPGGHPRELALDESPGALDALLASNPELKLLRSEARGLLRSAMQQSFQQLSPRERTLLRLHHLSGVPHGKLGEMMGAPRSTVAHWLAQARATLMDRTRAWLQRERALQPDELDSLIQAAGSRLDLTLSDVLATRSSSAGSRT